MLRNNMPTNWEPPYPAWESFWEDTSEPLVAGYFGIQAHVPELLDEWASRAFNGAHAPFAVEKGLHVDRDGAPETMSTSHTGDGPNTASGGRLHLIRVGGLMTGAWPRASAIGTS